MRNTFANNASTDIELSKTQESKIIQSGISFGSWLGNLGKKIIANLSILSARDNLSILVSKLASNDKIVSVSNIIREYNETKKKK